MIRAARKGVHRAKGWLHRRMRRPREPHGLVLLYHRIAKSNVDPWCLCVSPEHFDSQLRALRRHCDLVPLTGLHDQLRQGRDSRPAVAITFDDGYRDNLTVAKPMLERHEAPATVFVITGFVGRDAGFWWERLTHTTLAAAVLPTRIALTAGTAQFAWRDDALADTGSAGAIARRRLHDGLWNWFIDLAEADRCDALEALERWSGTPTSAEVSNRPMSAEDIRELAVGGLIDIGAHTVTHPRLSHLPSPVKRSEISRGREDCQRLLGRAPACFSYPNGDYDDESAALVRECGFALACTSRQDLVWASGDRATMPRISVRDEPGESLMRRLQREWFA